MDALAEYFDTNQDGVFDVLDKLWGQFAVWQDLNHDGVCDEGEMTYLDESHIASIDLNADDVEYDVEGNMVTKETTYTTVDGETMDVNEVYFQIGDYPPEVTDEMLDQVISRMEAEETEMAEKNGTVTPELNEEMLNSYIAVLEQEEAEKAALNAAQDEPIAEEEDLLEYLSDETTIEEIAKWLQQSKEASFDELREVEFDRESIQPETVEHHDPGYNENSHPSDHDLELAENSEPIQGENELDIGDLFRQAESAVAQMAADALTIPEHPVEIIAGLDDIPVYEVSAEEAAYAAG